MIINHRTLKQPGLDFIVFLVLFIELDFWILVELPGYKLQLRWLCVLGGAYNPAREICFWNVFSGIINHHKPLLKQGGAYNPAREICFWNVFSGIINHH